MFRVIKNSLKYIFGLSLTLLLLEGISFAILSAKSSGSVCHNRANFRIECFTTRTDLHPIYSKLFCDFIHKTQEGHTLVSKVIEKNIDFKKYKKIWFFGGSTTEGRGCDENQQTFVDLIADKYPQKKFINNGRSGKFTDYSINKLKTLLESGSEVDVVFWGHYINELLVNGDKRDSNFSELKSRFKLRRSARLSELKLSCYSVLISIYNYSSLVQLLTNFTFNIRKKFSSTFFLASQSESGKMVENVSFSFFPETFNGSTELWQNYALENYYLNIEKLYELSLKYGFKVVLLNMPHVVNVYEKSRPYLNSALEEWYEKVRVLMTKVSVEYSWKFIDIHSSFERERLVFSSNSIL